MNNSSPVSSLRSDMHRIAISGRRSTSASGKDRPAKIALVLRPSLCSGAKVDEIIWRVFDLSYDGEYEVQWHHSLRLSAVPKDAGRPLHLIESIEVKDTECIIVDGNTLVISDENPKDLESIMIKREMNSDDVGICTAIQMPNGGMEISAFYLLHEVIGEKCAEIKNDLHLSAYLVKEDAAHIEAGMLLNEAMPTLQPIKGETDKDWTIPTLGMSGEKFIFAWKDQDTLYACNNSYPSNVNTSESRRQTEIQSPETGPENEERPNICRRFLSFLSSPFKFFRRSFSH